MDRVALDELQIVVVVDNETDTLSTVDAGIPQLPEMARLLTNTPPSRTHEGHPCVEAFDHLCWACHGFSALVTARRGDEVRSVLFDTGPFPEIWLRNARNLRVDLASIEALFLSHWHFDHSGAFPEVVSAIAAARSRAGRAGVQVDLHPDRPDQRGIQLPDGGFSLLPPEPTLAAIEEAGGEVVSHREAHPLAGGLLYGSGHIDRVTSYETGLVGHHSFFGDEVRSDPLIGDERFLAAHVRGRGVAVLSACSHAGVVNACLSARAASGDAPLDLVLGGFHLAGRGMEERIDATVKDLAGRIDARLVAPGHCTGWRAKAALAGAFAPGRYAPSVVGSVYTLRAA
jgi:7,8-dihydropterin-6-yl-methyl-4-(beta-D-ribofuranosyl)aminobenzene 5'-phosphate synthase